MKKKEKICNYAFIDSQNLNLGIKNLGWALDFKKFRLYLRNKYHIQKAFLFIGYIAGNERLYTKLKNCGYVLVFKKTQKFSKGVRIKGNVDAELVLHAVVERDNYEKAFVVSGDGDFYCLIEYLKNVNKFGKLLVPNSKFSHLLKEFSEDIVYIQENKKLLEKKVGKIGGRSKP